MVRFGPSILALTALFKICRVAAAFVAAFLATKAQQERYITQVYMNQGTPPPLTKMLATFLTLYVLLTALAFGTVSALGYFVNEPRGNFMKRALLGSLDFGCELVATLIMGTVLAGIVQSKKYFSYQYEGLRGIRAYREMLVVLAGVNGLTPYFLAAPDSWR